MGKRIDVAEIWPIGQVDKNHVGITNFNGFNLLKDYVIYVHYGKDEDEQLFVYSKKSSTSLLLVF